MQNQAITKFFDGKKVRVTPDGRVALPDVFAAAGYTDTKMALANLKRRHPELASKVASLTTFPFGAGGRSPKVIPVKDMLELLMVLPGEKPRQFRQWAATVLKGFLAGEAWVAESVIVPLTSPPRTNHV